MDNKQFDELCQKLQDPQTTELNLEYSVFDGEQSRIDLFVSLLKQSSIKCIHLKGTGLGADGIAKMLKELKDRGGTVTHFDVAEGLSKDDIRLIAHSLGLDEKLRFLGGEQIRDRQNRAKHKENTKIQGQSSSKPGSNPRPSTQKLRVQSEQPKTTTSQPVQVREGNTL